MCIITAEEEQMQKARLKVIEVNKTSIFARHTKPGHQVLVYQLAITASVDSAMILPIPVVRGSGEDALEFIDLSGYPDLFDDLESSCNVYFETTVAFLGVDDDYEPEKSLKVHDVGDFIASYVPTMADFNRIDPRFRLSDSIWEDMPNYSDYGFVVFQLKITLSNNDEQIENKVHPMAFEFPTRESQKLFYPTVHVHDGSYHKKAGFIHALYYQIDKPLDIFSHIKNELESMSTVEYDSFNESHYFSSNGPASKFVSIDKCKNIITPDTTIYAMTLNGSYKNIDVWGDLSSKNEILEFGSNSQLFEEDIQAEDINWLLDENPNKS